MPVTDLFSKRQKRSRGEVPDMYQNESIPNQLRVQIVQVLQDACGQPRYDFGVNNSARAYMFIHQFRCIHF